MTNVSRFAYFLQTALTQLYVYIDFRRALRNCLSSLRKCFYEYFTCSLSSRNLPSFFDCYLWFSFRIEFFAASTSQEALRDDVDSYRISTGMTYDPRISSNTTESKIGTRRFKPTGRERGGGAELPGIRTSTTGTKIALCAFAINFLRSEYFAHSIKSSYPSLIYLLFNLYKL